MGCNFLGLDVASSGLDVDSYMGSDIGSGMGFGVSFFVLVCEPWNYCKKVGVC